jgi:hypothetical protein
VLAALDRKTGGELAKAYLDKLVAAVKPGLPPGAKFS